MWQAPNQRVRALQSAKKRQMDRLRRPIHFHRVRAEIKTVHPDSSQDQITEARVLLNDMSKKGMGVYSPLSLAIGQEILITIEQPRQIFLRGKIMWCQEFKASHNILSAKPFNFRLGVKFIFNSQKDEETIQAYCEQLQLKNYDAQAA